MDITIRNTTRSRNSKFIVPNNLRYSCVCVMKLQTMCGFDALLSIVRCLPGIDERLNVRIQFAGFGSRIQLRRHSCQFRHISETNIGLYVWDPVEILHS